MNKFIQFAGRFLPALLLLALILFGNVASAQQPNTFPATGKVGINTLAPDAYFQVDSSAYVRGGSGDVNGDGAVTIKDVIYVTQWLEGTLDLTKLQYSKADINGDLVVDYLDGKLIAEVATGTMMLSDANEGDGKRYINPINADIDGEVGIGLASDENPLAPVHVRGLFHAGDGDANGSGGIDASEGNQVFQWINGQGALSERDYALLDINGDGHTNMLDFRMIMLVQNGQMDWEDAQYDEGKLIADRAISLDLKENVGIGTGTENLLARLHVDNGSVMFGATSPVTDVPVSGAGARLMWLPGFNAFRAGEVTGADWDADSIGTYSIASGVDARATGTASAAFGRNVVAGGDYAMALGNSATASGAYAVAIGNGNVASGQSSTAMGYNTRATNFYSTALGDQTESDGIASTAMGYFSTATGHYSTAIGMEADAVGASSIAIGRQAVAGNTNSFALGTNVDVTAQSAMVIGSGASSVAPNRLENNRALSLMVGFNSNLPTLFVQASPGIDTTGNVGIGMSAPVEKLEVNGGIKVGFSSQNNAGTIRWNGTDFEGNDGTSWQPIGGKFASIGGTSDISYAQGGVAIGSTNLPAGYKLSVNGKIICEELKVELFGMWPDYVFEDDYELRSLEEVEAYIVANKHLPGIPSAAQVSEEGLSLGDMNKRLMEKVEELTLYVIELNKQVDALKKANEEGGE